MSARAKTENKALPVEAENKSLAVEVENKAEAPAPSGLVKVRFAHYVTGGPGVGPDRAPGDEDEFERLDAEALIRAGVAVRA